MTQYSKSPDRGSFYRNIWKKRLTEGTVSQNDYDAMMQILDESEKREEQREKTFNLEYDLRSSEFMLNKVRSNRTYAQNLYAALCNNEFFYNDHLWDCSWRYAGGIIADMLQEGDYIDWYCSGIGSDINKEPHYVGEGFVTEEVREDLLKLGWIVKPYDESYSEEL